MQKRTKTNIILIVCVILIVVIPLAFVKGEYGGSDDQGTAMVKKLDPSYKIWAHPLWTPPSGEIESLIFTVQGSLGTGVICYLLGNAHGKKKMRKQLEDGQDKTENVATSK